MWASGRLAGCAWAATTWSVAGAGNWSRTWRRPGSAKGGGHLATERLKKKPQPIHNARHAGTEHFALSGIGTDCGMPTRWERLAGDTDVFAVKVAFMDDPDDGLGADEDQWRSWGAFQIWVRGANLCSHLEEGERVESVHWYLLPLLEWIACSWDPLLHEERLPCKNDAEDGWRSLQANRFPSAAIGELQEEAWETWWQQWWSRHSIGAASEGGIFPDVVVRRCRDLVEISWGDTRSVGVPGHVSFTAAGPDVVRLSPQDVAAPL